MINLTKNLNFQPEEILMSKYFKVVISNKYVEIIKQANSPITKRTSSGGRKFHSSLNSENYDVNVKISITRARRKIRRLLECNFTDKYAFVTLTFAPSEAIDITNINSCNKIFADFKKRLAYYLEKNQLPKFKYLGVIEFQDNFRQGAIHYHIVCNLTEVPNEILQGLWQHGFSKKINIPSGATENEKIAFYLKKGITDPRLNGHKRYFHSQGLKQPITIEINNLDEFYNYLDECKSTLLEGGTYHTPFTGETKYENYYVENAKELMEYVQDLR